MKNLAIFTGLCRQLVLYAWWLQTIPAILLLSGCVKETGWQNNNPAAPVIIVDALLTDEVKTQRICLRRSVASLNETPGAVTGATILLFDGDSTWKLSADPAKPGDYVTPSTFGAVLGKNYAVQIFSGDQIFTARATMTPGTWFRELQCAYDEEKGLWHVDWVASAFDEAQAAMWELLIDWSKVPGYENSDSLDNHARLLFYTLPTLDVSEIFAPKTETVFFPSGTIITERRYSLSPDHAAFVREMLLETNWTGGLFTVSQANVSSNISGGALGFFGVCSVNEVSVLVGEKKK